MDGIQLSQGCSHFEAADYFLPLGYKKLLVLIFSTSEGWKAASTLEQHPVVLNMGPLDWEFSTLTSWALLHIWEYVLE